jgi:dTDP-4-amino-4,6-dideoxygalactose transaminase
MLHVGSGSMSYIPLVRPYMPNFEELETDIRSSIQSGQLTNFGQFSQSFERAIRERLNVKYAACVTSGTAGLVLLLSTLPRQSEVLVPSFTFASTVQALLWNSLKPVFIDIDSASYNLSPEDVYSQIGPRTSAILAVNVFGAPSSIDDLMAIAQQKELRLFFDSAHAFGSSHAGCPLGGFGNAEVFSFSATKLIVCGEGGVVTTNDEAIYEAVLERRNYGFRSGSTDCGSLGLNGKMGELNAILGIHGMVKLEEQIKKRNYFARRYIESFTRHPGLGFQKVRPGDVSTYKDFAMTVDPEAFGIDRGRLIEELRRRGIEAAAYFSPAIHQMTYFRKQFATSSSLVNTRRIAARVVSLPIYADLSIEEFNHIVYSIGDIRTSIMDL